MKNQIQTLIESISSLNDNERIELLRSLRSKFPIHKIESDWSSTAEDILEAISNAGPLNQRAVKGMLAEATFKAVRAQRWPEFSDITPPGDLEYDVGLSYLDGMARIQIKNQRSEKGAPKIIARGIDSGAYVVETQKTRNGSDSDGNPTRFYRFGSFDILAVCLYASTGKWSTFAFTLERWLLKRKQNPDYLEVLQPVHLNKIDLNTSERVWTTDLAECVEWLKTSRQSSVGN